MDESLLLPLHSADSMRSIDSAAIQDIGIPSGHLMERAGVAVAREILERYDVAGAVVVAGKGNNGGDGFVVARELANAGVDVVVLALVETSSFAGDARLNAEILERLGVEIIRMFDEAGELDQEAEVALEMADVVVDAIFGTGFTGAAKGTAAAAIQLINEAPGAVVSVDIEIGRAHV